MIFGRFFTIDFKPVCPYRITTLGEDAPPGNGAFPSHRPKPVKYIPRQAAPQKRDVSTAYALRQFVIRQLPKIGAVSRLLVSSTFQCDATGASQMGEGQEGRGRAPARSPAESPYPAIVDLL